ncbi:hypothetical protein GOP47_0023475 [Adiantum capillus-veneris]|uniref:Uncharacterized protein n=1 Tax=Adiantum capillus-veneris TaxID=13818 RepID=A0A9D4Z4J9_ADICA|nr:hypothetical protein GOP47_0023475 [Adiantum capillus-veneris]
MLTNPEWETCNLGDDNGSQPLGGNIPIETFNESKNNETIGGVSQNVNLEGGSDHLETEGNNQKGVKRARYVLKDLWTEASTYALIKHVQERWSHVNKGNFRTKDSDEVRDQLNKEVNGIYTNKQVRTKIDTLKKKIGKRKQKELKRVGLGQNGSTLRC